MMIKILPKSKTGKWSVGFIVVFFMLFGLMQLLVALGEQGGKNFFSNLKLAVSGLLLAFSGIAAFFSGAVSIMNPPRRKRRGIPR